jgi:hypothetical protein
MPTTRFPRGTTNAAVRSALHEYIDNDPTKLITFFDDFIGESMFPLGASGVGSLDNANWDFDVTEGGGGNAAIAVLDGHGGLITLTCDVADNDTIFVQSKFEAWKPQLGKKMWYQIRMKLNEATQSEFIAGVYVRDTDPFSATAGDGVSDGIYFLKEDASTTVKLYCQNGTTTSTQTSATAHTLVDDTFVVLGFYYDGVRYIEIWVDNVKITTLDTLYSGTTYFLPDTECALGFGVKQGEVTNAKVMTIDYIFCASER